ncbi:MAG: FHA domain-containing protein [[Clostridium] innocuum]
MAVPSFAIEEESGGYAVQKELESPTQELLAQDCSCLVDLKSWNSIRVDKAQFTIGRAKDNDLVLSGKTISQHHACIEEGVLKDCGSANGTYINGERITSRELKDQDVIRFANLQFRWQKEEIV